MVNPNLCFAILLGLNDELPQSLLEGTVNHRNSSGEVVYGDSISGIKGFTAQVLFTATNNVGSGNNELFAISTEFNESSY